VTSIGWWILVIGCGVIALVLVAVIAWLIAGARKERRGVRHP
jgi:hypothetical protein